MPREDEKHFYPRNETVGWSNQFGTSRPVTGVVVRRVAQGLVTIQDKTLVRVETFVEETGNGYILANLSNSAQNGDNREFIITNDFSLEYAMKLDYSTPSELTKGTSYNLAPTSTKS